MASLVAAALPALISQSAVAVTNTVRVKGPALETGVYLPAYGYHLVSATCRVESRPATAPRIVNMLPAEPDQTQNPIGYRGCPFADAVNMWGDYRPDGAQDFVYYLSFASLRDLGQWVIVCNAHGVYGSAEYDGLLCCRSTNGCPPVLCSQVCWESFQPARLTVDVYNDPAVITSLSVPPAATCPGSLAVSAAGHDPDNGTVTLGWIARPPAGGSPRTFGMGSTATLSLLGPSDRVGAWTVELVAKDDEDELTSQTKQVVVAGGQFDAWASAPSSVPVLRVPIDLSVSSEACGTPTTSWDIVQSPPRASLRPQTAYATGSRVTIWTASDGDIGSWVFRATSELSGFSDSDTVSVQVTNLPPRVDLLAEPSVPVGALLRVATAISDDDDGGVLALSWDLVQVPATAGIAPQSALRTGPSIEFYTTAAHAGTWIFRLNASDDEGETTTDEIEILVDALPLARISAPQMVSSIGSFALDGSASVDADSLHHLTDGRPPSVSPGLSYTWFVDPPLELWWKYVPGSLADSLGIDGSQATATVTSLEEGDWVFRLEVVDGEKHRATDNVTVTVTAPDTRPLAWISPPRRYVVDAAGRLAEAIMVSGAASFDPDNVSAGEAQAPGVGISGYDWQIAPPADCGYSPLQSSGSATLAVYNASAVIPSACQGAWRIGLTVIDDDTPAESAGAATDVIIGNCAGTLCIDAPTTFSPRVLDNADLTDVMVVYHVDPALYDNPVFRSGLLTVLEIVEEATGRVAHRAYDANVLAGGKGSPLTFNWNGFDDLGFRVPSGFYGVVLRLLDARDAATLYVARQSHSIWLEVATTEALVADGEYVDRDRLESSAPVRFEYQVIGALAVDEVCLRIQNGAGDTVASWCESGGLRGALFWDGRSRGVVVPPGFYTFAVEAYRAGQFLSGCARSPLTVYRLALAAHTSGTARGPQAVLVNDDDDDLNGAPDLSQTGADPDLLGVDIVAEPPLEGELTISCSAGDALRVWGSVARTDAIQLPGSYTVASGVPATLHLEGLAPSAGELSARLVLADGRSLPPSTLALRVVAVRLAGDNDGDGLVGSLEVIHAAAIGRWDNGYDLHPEVIPRSSVRNDAGLESFIALDPRRFHVRVHDPGVGAAFGRVGDGASPVALLTYDGTSLLDPPTSMELLRRDLTPDTYESEAQLLTTIDAHVPRLDLAVVDMAEDDAYRAHDGLTGPVDDEQLGDRTHMASLHGSVVVTYHPSGTAAPVAARIPVCGRAPDVRRALLVQPIVFKRQAPDGTYQPVADEAYVQAELERAALSWRQACIDVRAFGPTRYELPPVHPISNIPILDDGVLSYSDQVVIQQSNYVADARIDVLYVFFVNQVYTQTKQGTTWHPRTSYEAGFPERKDHTFVFLRSDLNHNWRVLAHEIGHALENGDRDPLDVAGIVPHWFYPSAATDSTDIHVTQLRRLSRETEHVCRLQRTGGYDQPGSTLLRPL